MFKGWLAGLLFLVLSMCAVAPVTAAPKYFLESFTLTMQVFELMVLQEAAYEPLMGRVAVAGVAIDRVRDDQWPQNLQRVLLQPRQFTGLWKPEQKYSQSTRNGARIAISIAMKGTRPCGEGVLWYHAFYIKPPYWTKDLVKACRIGQHIFYRRAP